MEQNQPGLGRDGLTKMDIACIASGQERSVGLAFFVDYEIFVIWHIAWGLFGMITNYLKTALRNIWINKGFSAINISGLALGMTCCGCGRIRRR
jgi:hypothetical protein